MQSIDALIDKSFNKCNNFVIEKEAEKLKKVFKDARMWEK